MLVNGLPLFAPCDCFLGLVVFPFLSCFPGEPLTEALLCPSAPGPPQALSQPWSFPYYSRLSLPPTAISPGGQRDDDSEDTVATVRQTRDVTVPGSHSKSATEAAQVSPPRVAFPVTSLISHGTFPPLAHALLPAVIMCFPGPRAVGWHGKLAATSHPEGGSHSQI